MFKEEKHDLYGPFWIMVTLIVEIAIVGFIDYEIDVESMMYEIKHGKKPSGYMNLYSLEKVGRAAFVMVAYFLLNPLMLYLLCKYVVFVEYIKFLWLFSIYGYSFSGFIITTALTVIPVDMMDWAMLIYSGLVSMIFIFMEMYEII